MTHKQRHMYRNVYWKIAYKLKITEKIIQQGTWLNKLQYLHLRGYRAVMTRKEAQLSTLIYDELQNILLSAMQKVKYILTSINKSLCIVSTYACSIYTKCLQNDTSESAKGYYIQQGDLRTIQVKDRKETNIS